MFIVRVQALATVRHAPCKADGTPCRTFPLTLNAAGFKLI